MVNFFAFSLKLNVELSYTFGMVASEKERDKQVCRNQLPLQSESIGVEVAGCVFPALCLQSRCVMTVSIIIDTSVCRYADNV